MTNLPERFHTKVVGMKTMKVRARLAVVIPNSYVYVIMTCTFPQMKIEQLINTQVR